METAEETQSAATVSNLENEADYDDEEEEEEEDVPKYVETDYKFDDFIKRLPHPKIVRACGLALKRFDTNTVYTNQCIVKLLHRISFDCKMYAMVFQLSIFRTFQRIFAMKDLPQYKELVKFATYIMRQFFKVAEENNKVFVEALFWKSKKDAYEIESGYGSYNEKSTAASKVWSEQEEDELRRLFMEHQHKQIEEDVVDWIVDNLIDGSKTRRMVLKKLKEMCLLDVGYKSKKKSGIRSKAPKEWGSDEEEHLRELWEEFKDAIDPMGCIMARLEINRPKNRVVEKMLVMGLIQDKKEVRKKRVKSSKRSSGRGRAQHSDESLASSSDSDQDIPARPSSSTTNAPVRHSNKNVQSKKSTKKRGAASQTSKPELIKMILQNTESGRQEALQWLKESFSDAIEDFEDGSDESVPLVPIMDYAITAMDEGDFQIMLKGFGVCEPFDEQESYWRIPSHLSIEELKDFCDLLQQALDNALVIPEEGGPSTQEIAGESSDEDYLDRMKKNKSQKDTMLTGGQQDKENIKPDGNVAESMQIEQPITIVESMETDREIANSQTDMNDSVTRKGRIRILSDSEEDEPGSKRVRSGSESSAEKRTTKKSRIIDSDDE
ncbi:unnamed protein product [Acanthoscelides obtectus]|uniref:Timeless C-terminal domain-containing protein n=1 Tax=Acanthoscelides obtectus TaxID=200917 RepID=A0A9P0LJU8_ACAOB|nr:unnamed protein product [Acanthoscelides obtectus]CAK1664182.1 Protein timeless homolog [Acanthoscelides obtectus]